MPSRRRISACGGLGAWRGSQEHGEEVRVARPCPTVVQLRQLRQLWPVRQLLHAAAAGAAAAARTAKGGEGGLFLVGPSWLLLTVLADDMRRAFTVLTARYAAFECGNDTVQGRADTSDGYTKRSFSRRRE